MSACHLAQWHRRGYGTFHFQPSIQQGETNEWLHARPATVKVRSSVRVVRVVVGLEVAHSHLQTSAVIVVAQVLCAVEHVEGKVQYSNPAEVVKPVTGCRFLEHTEPSVKGFTTGVGLLYPSATRFA